MANLILWNTLNQDYSMLRPAGPHQLASWLTHCGYTVKVIDFCSHLTTDELVMLTEKHIDRDTIAVGVSTTFWHPDESADHSYDSQVASSRTLKEGSVWGPQVPPKPPGIPNWVTNARNRLESRYPTVEWFAGGAKAHVVDYNSWRVFTGYAESTVLQYLDEKSKLVGLRPTFEFIKKGDTFMDGLGIQPHEVLPMELGRGCQFKCTFCSYPLLGKRKGSYIRDMSLIKEELISNYDRFGTTRYFFNDDTVNESVEKIDALAELAQTLPFKLEWIGYNRLDIIGSTRTQIESLRHSGLRSAFFGIESFGKAQSKSIGKPWNGKHGKDFLLELKSIWKNDITFKLSLIVGLTGESVEDLNKTEQWCFENDMHSWGYHPLFILRNNPNPWASEFDKNYANHGYKFLSPTHDAWWTNDLWDFPSATRKSFLLNSEHRGDKKAAAFQLGGVISTGYSIDQVIGKSNKELDWNEMRLLVDAFARNYVKFQLAL